MPDYLPGYRTIGPLGQGARSMLYRVVDTMAREFALKRVVRKDPKDQRFIEQVETEYEVSHGIEHPNLRHSVEIHRTKKWLTTTEVILLMEYVPGETLEQHKPNRLDHFLLIFRKVCLGLDALHGHGFIHADMKPNNIILGEKGVVKIIDFGQSCPIGHKKERIQGTPDYIAPEQLRKLHLDQRTDVYNLGATMYWTLTGQKYPTDVPDQLRGGAQVVKVTKPQTPKEINDKIPLALSQLIMECCRSNPTERPAEMGQVESRLKAVQTIWRQRLEELRAARQAAQEASPAPRENLADDAAFDAEDADSDPSAGGGP